MMIGFIRKKRVLKLIDARIKDMEKWENRWRLAGDEWRVARCRGAQAELNLLKFDITNWKE